MKLQKERQATQAAEAKAEEAESKMREAQAAVAQSADAALAQVTGLATSKFESAGKFRHTACGVPVRETCMHKIL